MCLGAVSSLYSETGIIPLKSWTFMRRPRRKVLAVGHRDCSQFFQWFPRRSLVHRLRQKIHLLSALLHSQNYEANREWRFAFMKNC